MADLAITRAESFSTSCSFILLSRESSSFKSAGEKWGKQSGSIREWKNEREESEQKQERKRSLVRVKFPSNY